MSNNLFGSSNKYYSQRVSDLKRQKQGHHNKLYKERGDINDI